MKTTKTLLRGGNYITTSQNCDTAFCNHKESIHTSYVPHTSKFVRSASRRSYRHDPIDLEGNFRNGYASENSK